MPPPQDPHDALFKAAFQSARHVEPLLRAILPRALRELVDWTSLDRDTETFVEASLHKRIGDLVFVARLHGGTATGIHVLFPLEHQSTAQRRFPLRGLRYVVGALERHDRDHPTSPLPLPVLVLVSNAPRTWSAERTLRESLDPRLQTLRELAPHLTTVLVDLPALDDDALEAMALPPFPTLALWALRDGRDKARVLRGFERWAPLLRDLVRSPGAEIAITQLFSYFLAVAQEMTFEDVRGMFEQVLISKETVMTAAEELMDRGRTQASARILRKLLVLKFAAIPTHLDARIAAASADELERYAERVLAATSIDAVFEV